MTWPNNNYLGEVCYFRVKQVPAARYSYTSLCSWPLCRVIEIKQHPVLQRKCLNTRNRNIQQSFNQHVNNSKVCRILKYILKIWEELWEVFVESERRSWILFRIKCFVFETIANKQRATNHAKLLKYHMINIWALCIIRRDHNLFLRLHLRQQYLDRCYWGNHPWRPYLTGS